MPLMVRTMSKSRRDGSTRRRCWTAMLLLVLAVATTGCGGKSDDSGTGSSVSTSERSDGGGDTTAAERSDGGGDTTVTRTPSLQRAFDDAKYYLDSESLASKSTLLQRMGLHVGESYSEAEALYVVNHADADWKARAVEDAKNHLENQRLSKRDLMVYLTRADGFSKAEATYAVSRIGRDWNAEAVEAAKDALEADALSKSELIGRLKRAGFTDAQVRHAVEKVY